MKLFSFQIIRVVLGWLIALGVLPLTVYADLPTPTIAPLNSVQLRVLLRTPTGQSVSGVAVTLVPAAPEFGGPPADTPSQSGQTDATGAVLFNGLQGAVWRVTFMGSYSGQPLQPAAEQGQPPYGTTRGDGFVVQTSLHEENDAPAPVVGVSAPPVETLAFVLVPTGGRWIPTIDLASPTDPPQPFSGLTQAPTRTMFYTPSPLPTGASPASELLLADGREDHSDGGFTVLWLLPAIAGGAALWRVWRLRRMSERSGVILRVRANARNGKRNG
jgi:hypothetical protein